MQATLCFRQKSVLFSRQHTSSVPCSAKLPPRHVTIRRAPLRTKATNDKTGEGVRENVERGVDKAQDAGSGLAGAIKQGVEKTKETLSGAVGAAENFREDRDADAKAVSEKLSGDIGEPTGGPKPGGDALAGPAGVTLTSAAGEGVEQPGAGINQEALKASDEMLSNEAKAAQKAGQARAESIELPDYPTFKSGQKAVDDRKPGGAPAEDDRKKGGE